MSPNNSFSNICDIDEMDTLAKSVADNIQEGQVITLSGDLGAGKTTFAQMLCKHLLIDSLVVSPTYTYLNIYEEKIAHFDLYRLKSAKDFFALGFEEYLDSTFITIIEWPKIIEKYLTKETINISFSHKGKKREVLANVKIFI